MFVLLRRAPRVPWMAVIPLASLLLGWLAEAHLLWGLPTLRSRYGTLSPQLFQANPDPRTPTPTPTPTPTATPTLSLTLNLTPTLTR